MQLRSRNKSMNNSLSLPQNLSRVSLRVPFRRFGLQNCLFGNHELLQLITKPIFIPLPSFLQPFFKSLNSIRNLSKIKVLTCLINGIRNPLEYLHIKLHKKRKNDLFILLKIATHNIQAMFYCTRDVGQGALDILAQKLTANIMEQYSIVADI